MALTGQVSKGMLMRATAPSGVSNEAYPILPSFAFPEGPRDPEPVFAKAMNTKQDSNKVDDLGGKPFVAFLDEPGALAKHACVSC